MDYEFLKIQKNPYRLENVESLPGKTNVEIKEIRTMNNDEAILELLSKVNMKKSFYDVKEYREAILTGVSIGEAEKLKENIRLFQMTKEDMQAILDLYKEPANENDDLFYTAPRTKSKPKTQKTFQRSVGAVLHEDMLDELKQYKHYQNEGNEFKVSQEYYLNDKRGFLSSIRSTLLSYLKSKEEELGGETGADSCDASDKQSGFHPLIHQEIVKQYLNATTPYHGLLLFHGLGSGKTCTSIGIIEAMKQLKPQIFVLSPASLKNNYKTQMKFCGSELFRTSSNWKFVKYPEDPKERELFITQVHKLTLLPKKYLNHPDRDGVYLVDKRENFNKESRVYDEALESQIDLMISERFHFISYNGINTKTWKSTYRTKQELNPFDHSTVIIDEGHNFVSRILNKLKTNKTSVSTMIYEDLITAENCNVVVLSGTPLINYPSELGVLFNIVGGKIGVIEIAFKHKVKSKFNKSSIEEALKDFNLIDYMIVETKTSKVSGNFGLLKIVKNPYGFVKDSKTQQIKYDTLGEITLENYMKMIIKKLKELNYSVNEEASNIEYYKRFDDTEVEFNKEFIKNDTFVKTEYFQNKILGLVSYIGNNRALMPDVVVPKSSDLYRKIYKDPEIFIEEIRMNHHVLRKYDLARSIEKQMDKATSRSAKHTDTKTSSYQIFSRSACNFVFPDDLPRPYPKGKEKEKLSEDDLEADDLKEQEEEEGEMDKKSKEKKRKYAEDIKKVMYTLENAPHNYFESSQRKALKQMMFKDKAKPLNIKSTITNTNQLSLYSPKFERILRNLMDEENNGLHMLYSNFRTLEGIGIFKLVLNYYGYTEFKLKKSTMSNYSYTLDLDHPYYSDESFVNPGESPDLYKGRKFYALYTGKEDEEEKEIIRNIYNGNLDSIPPSLKVEIQNTFFGGAEMTSHPNLHGELLQLLIISSSGAEGIDLKNVRYVHIMEPYWHPVRIDQVIGRARRICSHKDLPEEEQNVKVFMYLLTHNSDLLKSHSDLFTELIEYDYDKKTRRSITTDERLYMIMNNKRTLMEQFLTALKISAIDCTMNYEDKKKCLTMKVKGKNKSRVLTSFNTKDDAKEEFYEENVEVENNMGIGI